MYLWLIRTFQVVTCVVLGTFDACLTVVLRLLGLERDVYLREWQRSFGPKAPPQFPPEHEPGEPHYPYSIWDYHGYIRTVIVVDYLDRAKVEALLPDYLELAHVPDAALEKHPVLFSFGLNEHFGPVWMPVKTISYMELLVSIPDTQLKGKRDGYVGPFYFPPRLWLNRLFPTVVGRLLGYPKMLGRVPTTADSCTIRRLFGGEIARLKVTPCGISGPIAKIPGFGRWMRRANQPIATKVFFSSPLFTHFQWEWNLAKGQQAEVTLEVISADFPVLARGTYRWSPLQEGQSGAILVSSPFEWQIPFSRKILDESAAEKQMAAGV
ncbi:MAG: acetoacetate decarboxylase family protein [Acidobacteriia bacterium]|nr:acetoacetate decarboxylase family protein [Terriglobia bacterium]